MAFLQFAKTQMIQAMDSGETLNLGGFQPAVNGELRHVTLGLLKVGSLISATTLQMGIYLSEDFSSAYATSDSIFVTDIEAAEADITGDTWRAIVRFDFSRPNLNKNQLYYFALIPGSYTRTGDTNYLGVVRDEPYPIYSLAGANYGIEYPASKAVFAFVEPT